MLHFVTCFTKLVNRIITKLIVIPPSLFTIISNFFPHVNLWYTMFFRHHLFICIYRNAQPVEKLKDAYRKFLARSMTRPNATDVCNFLWRKFLSLLLFIYEPFAIIIVFPKSLGGFIGETLTSSKLWNCPL